MKKEYQEYLELTRLIERLHRRFIDVLKTELTRAGVRERPGDNHSEPCSPIYLQRSAFGSQLGGGIGRGRTWDVGFEFAHTKIESALAVELGRSA